MKTTKIKCPYCDKKIKGVNQQQVDYFLLQHKLSKHKDKIIIKEKK